MCGCWQPAGLTVEGVKIYITEITEVSFRFTLPKITKGLTETQFQVKNSSFILCRKVVHSLKMSGVLKKKPATSLFAAQAWAEGQVTLRGLMPMQHIVGKRAASRKMPEGWRFFERRRLKRSNQRKPASRLGIWTWTELSCHSQSRWGTSQRKWWSKEVRPACTTFHYKASQLFVHPYNDSTQC